MKIQFEKQERFFLQTAVAHIGMTVKGREDKKEEWPKFEALKRLHNQLSPESGTSSLGQDDIGVLNQVVDTAVAHLEVASKRELTDEQKIRLTTLTEVYSSIRLKLNQGIAQGDSNGHSTGPT